MTEGPFQDGGQHDWGPLTAWISAATLRERDRDALSGRVLARHQHLPILLLAIERRSRKGCKMPHSVTPESTPADEPSRTVSQATVKPEPNTQDLAMEDAPSPTEAEETKVNLEELFEDEDSDPEFSSSAPQIKSEEESSQPTTLCATRIHRCCND